MNRRNILNLTVLTLLGLALLPASVTAEQRSLKDQLVEAWTLVSTDCNSSTMRFVINIFRDTVCASRSV